ncbi:hypothetical protein POM88_013801 [Heracleum sosnowskyi]|uniref:TF-B3 domain-containing protein n=1 Tax=Heracleum sosnowskyi TaxID=360622 RepID=A0AAD8IZ87_9APIA|nr:hypothetical protein POM88_013801 [Heracleum sosnowskyi]
MESFDDEQTLDFFDVYLPDTNGQKLLIPSLFMENYKGKIPSTVTLKDLSGRCWQAEIQQTKEGFFIYNGWERFVIDNSVELGSFFVLRYVESSSSFVVKIFDPDGIKVEDLARVKIEDSDAEEETDTVQNYTENVPARNGQSPEGVKQSESPSRGSTVDKKRKFVKPTEHVPTENPCFRAKYRPSTPQTLYVPQKLLVQHSIKLNKSMNLLDHNGKVWPLTITHLRDGRTVIRQGWKAFLEHYNLDTQKEEMDLEIIRRSGTDCEELKVHIIKRVTPRGRGRPRDCKEINPRGPGRPRKWHHPSKSKASVKLSL